jgi:hypothetical protein
MEEINFSEMQVYDFSKLNLQEIDNKEHVSSDNDFQNSCDSCDCDHW